MRPQTLLLTSLALLLAGGLVFVLLGTRDDRDNAPATIGRSDAPLTAPSARPVTPDETPVAVLPSDLSPAAGRDQGGLQGAGPLAAVESDTSRAVDVIVLDRSGGALLGAAGSLPISERSWVRPVLGRGRPPVYREPLPSEGLVELSPRKRRVGGRTGWFNSFERPSGEAFIALAFGDHVLVAEPITPDAREVVLVSDLSDVEGMYARLEGRLPGMIEASKLVRVRPEAQVSVGGGRFPQTLDVGGKGDRFLAAPLPPGRVTVLVRGEAAALGPALFAARDSSGIGAISLGATVPDAEQWKLRIGVLRQLQLPIADIEVTLAPGESRDLGLLNAPRAGAAILELAGPNGRPVDATSVDVMVLAAPGEFVEPPLTWTFESTACLYPLHPRATELMIVQGDLGALVKLFPSELGANAEVTTTQVRLKTLGLVKLPEPAAGAPDPELWTADRHRVHNDPRWVGSRYHGHEVRGLNLAVPEGSYVVQSNAAAGLVPVSVRAGELVDVSSGTPAPGTLLDPPEEEGGGE